MVEYFFAQSAVPFGRHEFHALREEGVVDVPGQAVEVKVELVVVVRSGIAVVGLRYVR